MLNRRASTTATPKTPARRVAVVRTAVAGLVTTVLVTTGAVPMPFSRTVIRHAPVAVYGDAMVRPRVVRAARPIPRPVPRPSPRLQPRPVFSWQSRSIARASDGQVVEVSLTQYCLRGETRRGRWVRPGIVAADPRVFPLARYVEVFMGKHYLGRFLVDDTGKNVIGNTLDIWTSSCREARRFGRQWGHAVLVAREN
jgi:3D (Asp-Asp-Asp) domain-containing protein